MTYLYEIGVGDMFGCKQTWYVEGTTMSEAVKKAEQKIQQDKMAGAWKVLQSSQMGELIK